jgi:CDP-diacylglycerol--glycerol-3-phosphate 3-phosphatidyltransferase
MTETRISGTSAAHARRRSRAATRRGGGGAGGGAVVRAGLYGFKPWFAERLAGVRWFLVRRSISPNTISLCGVGFGALAGLSLATLSVGAVRGLVVGALLVARLGCANLDGGVARELGFGDGGSARRFGGVVNELGDRCAELAALAGCAGLVGTPGWLLGVTALACSAPSWVSLAGAAAGAPRVQGGPVGKTERCLLLVVIAAIGHVVPVLYVLGVGSALTAVVRVVRVRSLLVVSTEGTTS